MRKKKKRKERKALRWPFKLDKQCKRFPSKQIYAQQKETNSSVSVRIKQFQSTKNLTKETQEKYEKKQF